MSFSSYFFFLNIWEISVEKIFSSSFITFDIFQMKSLYDFFLCFLPYKPISYYWFLNEIFFLFHLYYTCTHTYILLIRDFFSTLLLEIMSLKFSLSVSISPVNCHRLTISRSAIIITFIVLPPAYAREMRLKDAFKM